mgnify:CR=1 FL=1
MEEDGDEDEDYSDEEEGGLSAEQVGSDVSPTHKAHSLQVVVMSSSSSCEWGVGMGGACAI